MVPRRLVPRRFVPRRIIPRKMILQRIPPRMIPHEWFPKRWLVPDLPCSAVTRVVSIALQIGFFNISFWFNYFWLFQNRIGCLTIESYWNNKVLHITLATGQQGKSGWYFTVQNNLPCDNIITLYIWISICQSYFFLIEKKGCSFFVGLFLGHMFQFISHEMVTIKHTSVHLSSKKSSQAWTN